MKQYVHIFPHLLTNNISTRSKTDLHRINQTNGEYSDRICHLYRDMSLPNSVFHVAEEPTILGK